MPPSPLDGPFHFDDPPLSAWYSGDQSFAAPRSAVDAKALRYSAVSEPPVVPPDHPADPIAIEIVRGANGPTDDGWTVLVDGMRCKPKPEILKVGPNVFRYELPECAKLPEGTEPGVSRRISTSTRARPVVVGVRLEDEALAPDRVRLCVDQILTTSERQAQSRNKPEVKEIMSVDMEPYRVSDLKSSVVTLQYPFHSPTQSTLGIISLKEFIAWEQRSNWVQWYNTLAPYLEAAMRFSTTEDSDGPELSKATKFTLGLEGFYNYATGNQNKEALNIARKQELMILGPDISANLQRIPKAPDKNSARTVRIGGGMRSSARELGNLFERLALSCMAVDQIGEGDSQRKRSFWSLITGKTDPKSLIQARIFAMEGDLQLSGDSKALVLLNALCDSQVSDGTKAILTPGAAQSPELEGLRLKVEYDEDNKKFKPASRKSAEEVGNELRQVAPVYEGSQLDLERGLETLKREYDERVAAWKRVADNSTEEERGEVDLRLKSLEEDYNKNRQSLEEALSKKKPSESKGPETDTGSLKYPYVFTYNRLTPESRRKTMVKTRIRVEVFDRDQRNASVFEFEAPSESGVVAHAIYSGLMDDINFMNEQAERFLDCLLGPYVEGGRTKTSGLSDASVSLTPVQMKRMKAKARTIEGLILNATIDVLRGAFNSRTINVLNLEAKVAELRIIMNSMLVPNSGVEGSGIARSGQSGKEEVDEGDILDSVDSHVDFTSFKDLHTGEFEFDQSERPSTPSALPDVYDVGAPGVVALFDEYTERKDKEAAEKKKYEEIQAGLQEDLRTKVGQYYEEVILERKNALEMADRDDDNSVVYANKTPGEGVLTRRLPQLLIPSHKSFNFHVPETTDPPNIVVLFENNRFAQALKKAAKIGVQGVLTYFGLKFIYSLALSQLADQANEAGGALMDSVVRTAASGGGRAASFFNLFVTNGQSVIDNARKIIQNEIKFNGKLSVLGAVLINNFQTQILADSNLKEAYSEHARKERGIPVKEAFACAMSAVEQWKKSEQERLKAFNGLKDASVVYNPVSGKRFCFVEHFRASGVSRPESAGLLHSAGGWETAPKLAATMLLPPPDADVAYYDTQQVRGIPLDKSIQMVAGSSDSGGPLATWMATGAAVAFSEVARELSAFLRKSHNGQRIEQPLASLAMQIALRVAYILKSVYGEAAGVTLVDGGDILWSCIRAAAFARLAVRNVSVFALVSSYDGMPAGYGDEGRGGAVASAVQFWQVHRRVVIDGFAAAFLEEAKQFSKLSLREQYSNGIRGYLESENGDYEGVVRRTAALVRHALAGAELEAVKDILLAGSGFFDEDPIRGRAMAELAWESTKDADQERFNPPDVELASSEERALWACRRIDSGARRSLPIGKGADYVIEELSSLTAEDTGKHQAGGVFYCPVGSRLRALPKDPFDVNGLNQRVVWVSYIIDAAKWVQLAVQPLGAGDSRRTITCSKLGDDGQLTGLQRSPTSISVRGSDVAVRLSALSSLDESDVATSEQRTLLMRERAFNSDRLLFALSLAYSFMTTPQELSVILPDGCEKDVLSLALALAMRRAEAGSRDDALLRVIVQIPEKAVDLLRKFVANLELVESSGWRVFRLSELAMSL